MRFRFARWIKVKPHTLVNRRPIVTFTFDDFPRSAARTGFDILEKYSVRGTYYVCAGLQGTRNEIEEYASAEDIIDVVTRGHELACHTFSHLDGLRASPGDLARDIDRNSREVAALLNGYKYENFAYPYGRICHGLQVEIAKRFTSGRGVFRGINQGTIDLANLSAELLYHPVEQQATAHRLIEENARVGGWLIFVTHDIGATPSPYGCTEPQLNDALRAATESGAEILTVREALKKIGATPSH
ncbi:MAG: polysaccharide deacetylase family protein [Rhodospirillales bacterium]|nr:polysaccharide deacetylase family protein [Rhodospirillales bacterium]